MPISTAPALLIGLGARILLDTVNPKESPPTIRDIVLLGVWQGVGLQYAGGNTYATIVIGVAIAAKLLVDFSAIPDTTRCISTILGVALGVIGTDLLSSYLDQYFVGPTSGSGPPSKGKSASKKVHGGHHHDRYNTRSSRPPERARSERLVQFRASVQGGSVTTQISEHRPQSAALTSDITSVDSSSGLLFRRAPTMTPLEREIAALRARASLADSERRRCREERKWAVSQGNLALAEELKANYKRFKALMEDCHQQADAKLLEDAREKDSLRNVHGTSRRGSSNLRDSIARIFNEEAQNKQQPVTSQDRRHRKVSLTKVSSRNPNR